MHCTKIVFCFVNKVQRALIKGEYLLVSHYKKRTDFFGKILYNKKYFIENMPNLLTNNHRTGQYLCQFLAYLG
ncbi:hypothetical protein [Moraxella lacunata]|uniref:hypothetical protein n=1 Tax=Moraxella lacunata TaxID=477 RepID=UPI003EE1ECFB